MTISDWKKMFKQLKGKTVKMKKYLKHNSPKERSVGRTKKRCERCGRYDGHISKYGLNYCRCCFREVAVNIGFKKFS